MPRLSDNPAIVQGQVATPNYPDRLLGARINPGTDFMPTDYSDLAHAYPTAALQLPASRQRERSDLCQRMQYRNTALDYAIKVNVGINGSYNTSTDILTTAKAFYKFLRYGKTGVDNG